MNIAELTVKVYADDITFSNNGLAEMRTFYGRIEDMFRETMRALEHDDYVAVDKVMHYEGEVNLLQRQYLAQHTQRLCEGKCSPISALIFVDFINNLEKMGDHLTNVAQAARRGFSFETIPA